MSNTPLHFKIIESPAGTNEIERKHSTRLMITFLELRTLHDMSYFTNAPRGESNDIYMSNNTLKLRYLKLDGTV